MSSEINCLLLFSLALIGRSMPGDMSHRFSLVERCTAALGSCKIKHPKKGSYIYIYIKLSRQEENKIERNRA